jgi:alpha/beta hydrolase fold
MIWFWDNYTKDIAQRVERYASPLRATAEALRGLPPALVQTAYSDVLGDEGEAYARRLNEAGVEVVAVRYNGLIHDWASSTPSPRSRRLSQITGLQTIALCAIVCGVGTWRAHPQNQMAGSVRPTSAHRRRQFEGGDRARRPRPDRRGSRRRNYQATGRARRPRPLWRPPHAGRLSGEQPRRVPLRVPKNECDNIDPDELLTLREIGAAWLAADAQHIAQAIERGILQEVDNDDQGT